MKCLNSIRKFDKGWLSDQFQDIMVLTRSAKFSTPVFAAVSSLLEINLLPFEFDVEDDNPIEKPQKMSSTSKLSIRRELVCPIYLPYENVYVEDVDLTFNIRYPIQSVARAIIQIVNIFVCTVSGFHCEDVLAAGRAHNFQNNNSTLLYFRNVSNSLNMHHRHNSSALIFSMPRTVFRNHHLPEIVKIRVANAF